MEAGNGENNIALIKNLVKPEGAKWLYSILDHKLGDK